MRGKPRQRVSENSNIYKTISDMSRRSVRKREIPPDVRTFMYVKCERKWRENQRRKNMYTAFTNQGSPCVLEKLSSESENIANPSSRVRDSSSACSILCMKGTWVQNTLYECSNINKRISWQKTEFQITIFLIQSTYVIQLTNKIII